MKRSNSFFCFRDWNLVYLVVINTSDGDRCCGAIQDIRDD